MSGTFDDDKVVPFKGFTSNDYHDHDVFLDMIKEGIKERDVLNTVVLVFDKQGGFTLNSSTGDTERVLALLTMAKERALEMWCDAVTAQAKFESEARERAGEDNDPDGGDAA